MEYFISFDGDGRESLGTNLAKATDEFWKSVECLDFCPRLEDEDGVILAAYANDTDDGGLTIFIGPQVDRDWEREYGGWDRIAEEHEYKFGDWRL